MDTRVKRGADVASNHHLVQTRVRLKLKKIIKPTTSRIRYDVDKLRHKEVRKEFTLELRNRFAVLEEAEDDDYDINSKWAQFSKAYNNTAENVLGRKRNSSKPWISPESWAKVEERKQLKGKAENAKSERIQQQLRAKYRSKDKEGKKSLKSDKREWLNSLMDDAQHAADMGNMKTLYGITKTICNERTHKITAINDKGGKTITDDSSGLARWKEHFEEILNRPPPTNSIVITADDVPEIEEKAKIIRIVQLLYQESECAVLDSGQTSEWFKIETGVKQGCVMSGFLFLLAIDRIMCETVVI